MYYLMYLTGGHVTHPMTKTQKHQKSLVTYVGRLVAFFLFFFSPLKMAQLGTVTHVNQVWYSMV